IRVDARRACGFVDKANALPTTPQAQQHQQKRSIDVVPKADNLVCYRQSGRESPIGMGITCRDHRPDVPATLTTIAFCDSSLRWFEART
ncbi:MAG: hypothetical protein QF754_10005, partial [Alphaproteobacteria bacterium]|nr:hypothetical protein [Alphaproteobacteria bacterium]